MFGREASEVFEVTEWDPPRALGLYCDGRLGSSKKGEFRFRYRLEPRGSGTEVILSGRVEGMGAFVSFLAGLFKGWMCKAFEKDLKRMKQWVETGKVPAK